MRKLALFISLMMFFSVNAQNTGFFPINGDTMTVAKRVIFVDAEQPCGTITSAKRDSKNYIIAMCSNGEKYIVAQIKNAPMNDGSRKDVPIALRCSKAKEYFNLNCP